MVKLFEPVRLGPVEVRNRTIRAAAFEGMAPGHRPSRELIEYHRSVAAGGVGMTTVAYAAVEQSGLSFPHQLWLRPEIVSELRVLTDAVHAEGARASIQIGHCGNMAHTRVAGGRPLSPSGRFNLYGPNWPRAMDRDDIARVTDSFARGVSLARGAGFDAVEVHAGHGYLISQFLSPYTNHRRDAYGGPLVNRMRFMREVMSAVKRAARSDIAVLVKMNLSDGFAGGCTLDDAIVIARALEEEGANALVLSGGFVSRAPMHVMHGSMPTKVMGKLIDDAFLALGVSLFGQWLIRPVPYEPLYFLRDARVIRRELRMPLVYIGGADSRAAIDRALDEGFDAVAMARALIQDPGFVNRLAREEAARSPCDHCNYCAARIYSTSMACYQREPPSAEILAALRDSPGAVP